MQMFEIHPSVRSLDSGWCRKCGTTFKVDSLQGTPLFYQPFSGNLVNYCPGCGEELSKKSIWRGLIGVKRYENTQKQESQK